jgi:hypothetical protein
VKRAVVHRTSDPRFERSQQRMQLELASGRLGYRWVSCSETV